MDGDDFEDLDDQADAGTLDCADCGASLEPGEYRLDDGDVVCHDCASDGGW